MTSYVCLNGHNTLFHFGKVSFLDSLNIDFRFFCSRIHEQFGVSWIVNTDKKDIPSRWYPLVNDAIFVLFSPSHSLHFCIRDSNKEWQKQKEKKKICIFMLSLMLSCRAIQWNSIVVKRMNEKSFALVVYATEQKSFVKMFSLLKNHRFALSNNGFVCNAKTTTKSTLFSFFRSSSMKSVRTEQVNSQCLLTMTGSNKNNNQSLTFSVAQTTVWLGCSIQSFVNSSTLIS